MVKFEDVKEQIEYHIYISDYEKEGWDLYQLRQDKPWLPIFCDSLLDEEGFVSLDAENEEYGFRDFDDLPLQDQKYFQNTFYSEKDAIEYIIGKKIDISMFKPAKVKKYYYRKYKKEIMIREEERKIWCVEYDFNSDEELHYLSYDVCGWVANKKEFKDGIWHVYMDYEAKQ